MKAIETIYKGYRFRSRLEARWAVFFDAVGIKGWQYEPQGFELSSGPYLPDFWVPLRSRNDWGYWVEIKGARPLSVDQRLLGELCEQSGHSGYMLIGTPGEQQIIRYERDGDGCYLDDEYGKDLALWATALVSGCGRCSSGDIKACIDAARQARFEHGQVGAPSNW